MVERALQVYVNKVLALLLLWRRRGIEVDFAYLDQILDVMGYFISCSDLLRKLSLVQHPLAPEKTKDQHISQQCRGGVHLDGVQSVEELYPIELENELPQYLLAQEGGLALAVEEDDAEEAIRLLS
jgi:hypothetical protein